MDRNDRANITCIEKTQKSTQDDLTTAIGTQYLDYLIKIASWYKFLAADETKMGSKDGIETENLLNQLVRPTVLEYDSILLGPKLM